MTKRRLTRKQAWRIDKVQQEKSERLNKKADVIPDQELGDPQEGNVVSHFGTFVEVEPSDSKDKSVRCHFRTNLGGIVTGDRVVWRDGKSGYGVIEAVLPRHSLLSRPDVRGNLKPVAANIDFIVLVITPEPTPSGMLIDRYLVAAQLQGIPVKILLNKTDLITPLNEESLFGLLSRYEDIGYHTLTSSTKTREGLDALIDCLNQHTSVFVGQSGVGKSSLVNALLPGVDIKVAELSEGSKLGRHTTTNARLFHFPHGGDLIDSPGIREFGLWHLDPGKVIEGYVDFQEFLGYCKFRDCRHQNEPGCALKSAVSDGKIDAQRFENYFSIVAALEDHNK